MYERNYHAKVLKTDEKSPKKKKFPLKRALIILSTILVIAGIVILMRVPAFQVREVQVTGTNVADPIDVSQVVLAKLEGKYLWILPKTSIFLVSTKDLQSAIAEHFPRFKTIAVDRAGMHSLKVAVTEYPGAYLWCDTNDVCSFMDETGTVFADAPYFSGSAYLKIYIGDRAPYPFHPIPTLQIVALAHLRDRLQVIGINPLSVVFESEHKMALTFIHHTSRAMILFDSTADSDASLETLYTGLKTEPVASMYRNSQKVLEYIDLRFANKLIYKFN